MNLQRIEDLADSRVALYRNVRDSALRDEQGLFLAESRLCVQRLLDYGRHRVRSVLLTEAALDALRDTLEEHAGAFPVYLASAELLQGVVGFNLHRGCIAAAERGVPQMLDALLTDRSRLLVGLEGVANPENVGNVFRNAAAFGATGVVLSDDCADPLYRKAIRVSMGATLRTPYARVANWPDAFGALRAAEFRSIAFSTGRDAKELQGLGGGEDLEAGTLLLFGAEGEGLRPATISASDCVVRIPMAPDVDSLNVATASGVALHHVFEQRAQRSLATTSRADGSESTSE